MKAVICTKYGLPEVLQFKEIEKPVPKKDEVLIRIHTTAVTASDGIIRSFRVPRNHKFSIKQLIKFMMRLFLGFTKPRNPILGLVFSGSIESVGNEFKQFKKGDQVYGFTAESFGTYAEYMCLSKKDVEKGRIALKPNNMNYEEATAVTYGGVLALHYMKKMNIQKKV